MSSYQPYYDCLTENMKNQQTTVQQICNMLNSNLTKKHFDSKDELGDSLVSLPETVLINFQSLTNTIQNPETCLFKIGTPAKMGEGYDEYLKNIQADPENSSYSFKNSGSEEYFILDRASDTQNIFLLKMKNQSEYEQFEKQSEKLTLDYVLNECHITIGHTEL